MREPIAERRSRLAGLVAARGFVRVTDVADELLVSEVTIRGDFTALEKSGGVVRVHGGAMPRAALGEYGALRPGHQTDDHANRSAPDNAPDNAADENVADEPLLEPLLEPSLEQSQSRAAESKRAIGEAAAALVSSGQSVILDVGSTALAVAFALVRRTDLDDVTIITNGLSIALALEPGLPRFTVVMTGGTLRPLQHSLVNPGVSGFLESVHADFAIIGCNGVDVERGVTNINYPEAEVKRRMVQSSTRRILIADGSKLGQAHLGVIGALADFDVLVTSGTVSAEQLESIGSAGVQVVRVE